MMKRSGPVKGIFSAVLVALSTLAIATPASAELSKDQIDLLNPKWTKYKNCPTNGPCYMLDTRFIAARITDPSEVGQCQLGISSKGDENYVLPMFAIIDGMGMNSDPLSLDNDQEFRVNVTKRTWEGKGRGSNLGTQWYDRVTTDWVTLARQERSKTAAKQLQWRDYVTPINRTSFVNDGMIMTMNFMEHDNALTADLDRLYYQKALEFKNSLVSTSDATAVRRTLAASPDYTLDATIQSATYLAKLAPKVAAVVVAAKTGGASAAVASGATDLGSSASLVEKLYDSLILLDTDDVGQQKTVFVSFKDLPLGREVEFNMSGKVDPTACDTGGFEVKLGVKLSKVADNPAYKPAARPAAAAGLGYVKADTPKWVSTPNAGLPISFVPGAFTISNSTAQAAADLKLVTVAYFCNTRDKTSDPVGKRCAPSPTLGLDTPGGYGNFTFGGGAARRSDSSVEANYAGRWAVLGTSLVQGNKLLAITYSDPVQVGAVIATTTVPAAATGAVAITATAQPRFTGALTPGQKFPITQGTFSVANGTNAAATVMVVTGIRYCDTPTTPINSCANGGVINSTQGTQVARGTTVTIGGSSGSAGLVPADKSGKYVVLVTNAVNKVTQEILATTSAAPVQLGGGAAAAPAATGTLVAPAPVAGDCPRISGSQATARTCPQMTVVGGGNARANSKILVTAGTYDTGSQRATRQVFLYACTAQDHATCTNIGFGVNVDYNGSYTFDLAALGGASLVGKYLHAESFVQNPSTFAGLGTFDATPRYIGVNG
jgi:hypothetical protein